MTQIVVYGALTLGVARARSWLVSRPRGQRTAGRIVGTLLLGAALITLLESWWTR